MFSVASCPTLNFHVGLREGIIQISPKALVTRTKLAACSGRAQKREGVFLLRAGPETGQIKQNDEGVDRGTGSSGACTGGIDGWIQEVSIGQKSGSRGQTQVWTNGRTVAQGGSRHCRVWTEPPGKVWGCSFPTSKRQENPSNDVLLRNNPREVVLGGWIQGTGEGVAQGWDVAGEILPTTLGSVPTKSPAMRFLDLESTGVCDAHRMCCTCRWPRRTYNRPYNNSRRSPEC